MNIPLGADGWDTLWRRKQISFVQFEGSISSSGTLPSWQEPGLWAGLPSLTPLFHAQVLIVLSANIRVHSLYVRVLSCYRILW